MSEALKFYVPGRNDMQSRHEGAEVLLDVQFRSDGGSMNVLQNRLTLYSTVCLF
jgi:hypothetical protein